MPTLCFFNESEVEAAIRLRKRIELQAVQDVSGEYPVMAIAVFENGFSGTGKVYPNLAACYRGEKLD